MNAPEDQNGLREALAYPQWREVVRLLENCTHPLDGPALRLFRDEGRLILEALNLVIAERDAAVQLAYDLKYAAAGGEDAPGSANAVAVADVDRWRREATTRISAAEAELDEERQESARLALAVTERQAEIARLKRDAEAASARHSKTDIFGIALHALEAGLPGIKPVVRDAVARTIALRIRSSFAQKEHPHG